MPGVLFLIEDGSFVFDNRVRREAGTLHAAGWKVSVICPAYPGEKWRENVNGILVYRYRKACLGPGFGAHLIEYLISLAAQTFLAALVALETGFDVIHAANPPDLLWVIALPYRMCGKRFIFDHHDLVPELYADRFGQSNTKVMTILRWLERTSIRLADCVISTNESYRRIAMERGPKAPDAVTVVRNGPDLGDFPEGTPDLKTRGLGKTVVGYLGNMNPQDGVDRFLEMARIIRIEKSWQDFGFVMIGAGDAYEELKALRDSWGLADAVAMTGRIPWREVLAVLRATDICVQPDPPGGLNDHSTMNKLMEYMMLGKAVVAYSLPETMVSGGDACVYVRENSSAALAEAVMALADDPAEVSRRGRAGRQRVERYFAWHHQSQRLLEVYARISHRKAAV